MERLRLHMGLLFVALAAATGAQPEAQEIVRRTAEADRANWEKSRELSYVERVSTDYLDGENKVEKTESIAHQVIWLEGSPYKRVVERNGKPLPPEEEKFEADKLKAVTGERRSETPEMRSKRISEAETARNRNRAAMREVPDAFNFTLAGEETVNGRPAWVLAFEPKPGYQPKDKRARMFPHLKGKLWVDKQDYHWCRAEAELFETFSFGWILVRVSKGSRVTVEQARTPEGVWMQSGIQLTAEARIGLLKHYRVRQQTTASGIRAEPVVRASEK